MIKKGLSAVVAACFLSTTSLLAQGNTTVAQDVNKSVEASSKTESNATKSDNRVEAAKVLLEEMGLEAVYKKAVENSTKRLVDANPNFKKIESKIKDFYENSIGWSVMKDDLAKLYAKYYTTDELKDITNFYKTKTGKKVLKTMGNLTYEGQMLTRKRLLPHMEELKKMLDKAAKEGEKKEAKAKKSNKKETKAKNSDKKDTQAKK
jgi:hypothetical protein